MAGHGEALGIVLLSDEGTQRLRCEQERRSDMAEQEQRGVVAVMPMNKVITLTRLNRRRACCRSISSRCPGWRGAGVRGGARNRGPVVEQALHGEDEEI
ncbi:hypothetical protein [Streptomyces sp. NPDC005148]